MRIVFVTSGYPAPGRPGPGTFVRQFVRAMARHGHECAVISPVSVFERRHGRFPPRFSMDPVAGGPPIAVHRPRYLSFSAVPLGWTNTARWTNVSFARTVLRTVRRLPARPDVLYGHFLYPAAHAAAYAARAIGVPSIAGVGEGEFWTVEPVGYPRAARQLQKVTAFLAVSTCIAERLVSRLGIPVGKIGMFPNGVDRSVFSPRDRAGMCRKLGIPEATFHVGFAGPFIEQKGYPQLVAAVAGLAGVQLVLLGRGAHPAGDPRTAFCGSVEHEDIPDYLGACDVFVLPTRIEGSCNSVIEAMACGLPVVTANGRHMDDIVDDNVAIRVDPGNVPAIRAAIQALQDDPERRSRMAAAALAKAREFDIGERARRVTAWMEAIVQRQATQSSACA